MDESNCESAWYRRHGEHFDGKAIPFGAGVFFKPASSKYVPSKTWPRLEFGIFPGYRLHPGCRWNGEYLVASIDDFVGQNFAIEARWAKINPHVTKIVLPPKTGICFPFKQRYEQANCTLEGREAAAEAAYPDLGVSAQDEASAPREGACRASLRIF